MQATFPTAVFARLLVLLFFTALVQPAPTQTLVNHAAPTKQILFICTGNFYRSRFAECLFNQKVRAANAGWTAISRGLQIVLWQHGLSPYARRELKKRGVPVDIGAAAPKMVTQDDLDRSDYVVLLSEAEHRLPFEKRFPNYDKRKVHWWHIPDSGAMDPAKACEKMSDQIDALVKTLR
jgi:protein-tyrosine phosphatase